MVPERSATSRPLRRGRISPAHGSSARTRGGAGPCPRLGHQLGAEAHEAHAGTRCSRRTQPVPWLTICSIRPLRSASNWVTAEVLLGNVDGHTVERLVDHAVDLAGQHLWLAHRELEALASHHLHQHDCSSPRPCTSQVSGRRVGRTRMLTLPTTSWSRRLRTRRAVSWALAARQRRRVGADRHRQAGLVDVDDGQRAGARRGRPASRRW